MDKIAIVTGAPCAGKSTLSASLRFPVIHVDAYIDSDGSVSGKFDMDCFDLLDSHMNFVVDVDAKRFAAIVDVMRMLQKRRNVRVRYFVLKPPFSEVLDKPCREGKIVYPDAASAHDWEEWYAMIKHKYLHYGTREELKRNIIAYLK